MLTYLILNADVCLNEPQELPQLLQRESRRRTAQLLKMTMTTTPDETPE